MSMANGLMKQHHEKLSVFKTISYNMSAFSLLIFFKSHKKVNEDKKRNLCFKFFFGGKWGVFEVSGFIS